MSVQEKLQGIAVPLITPLTSDENLDEEGLRQCLRYVLSGGVNGVFVLGTTGESACLREHVKEKVLEVSSEEIKGKSLFLAGVSDTSTKRVLDNIKKAERFHADAVVAHPPFFFGLNDQKELITFYRTLTDSTDLPIILYNIPSVTKQPLAIDTIRQLLENPRIIGIKDSSVDFVFMLQLIALKKEYPDFKVFVGKSHLFTSCLMSGGDGGVDGIVNLIPGRCVRLVELLRSGAVDEALLLQEEVNAIWEVYRVRSFISGVKMAMHLAGLCAPTITSPLIPASEDEKKHIYSIIINLL